MIYTILENKKINNFQVKNNPKLILLIAKNNRGIFNYSILFIEVWNWTILDNQILCRYIDPIKRDIK